MIIRLSRIVPRDPESAVLCYQQAAHRHQFAQLPHPLDVTPAAACRRSVSPRTGSRANPSPRASRSRSRGSSQRFPIALDTVLRGDRANSNCRCLFQPVSAASFGGAET